MVDLDNSMVLYGEMAETIHHDEETYRKLIARIDESSEDFTKRICRNNDPNTNYLKPDFETNHNDINSDFTSNNTTGVYEMITEILKDGVSGVTLLDNEQNELPITLEQLTHTVKSMQEILPGVYLGPYLSATNAHFESLVETGITHIVCVRQENESHFIRPNFVDTFKYLVVELTDSVYESIIPHFTAVRKFLEECRSQGGKVLVHGNSGISRSAALVLAYVMEEFCFTYTEAFKFVQERRFCIQPNAGFIAQLQEFEPILRARRTFQLGQSSGNQRNKRRRDHDDDNLDYIPLPPPPSPVNEQLSGSIESMDIGFCA